MLRRLAVSLLFAMLLWATSPAGAQPAGSLFGRVLDETLPGVNVHLHHARGEMTKVTDATGTYVFEGLRPGRVELTFRLINFTLVKREVLMNEAKT